MTLVIPSPLRQSQAFLIDGSLDLRESLVVQNVGAISSSKGAVPELRITDSCFTAGTIPEKTIPAGKVKTKEKMHFPPPTENESFNGNVITGESCQTFGARITPAIIPKRQKL